VGVLGNNYFDLENNSPRRPNKKILRSLELRVSVVKYCSGCGLETLGRRVGINCLKRQIPH
jgi:hypothetical protein